MRVLRSWSGQSADGSWNKIEIELSEEDLSSILTENEISASSTLFKFLLMESELARLIAFERHSRFGEDTKDEIAAAKSQQDTVVATIKKATELANE